MGGACPSSGEAADGDGAAAAAERQGPASGLLGCSSVDPTPPHWAVRARVGNPAAPPPSLPLRPSPSPPSLRAELPQVSEGRGLGEAQRRGLGLRGGGPEGPGSEGRGTRGRGPGG